MSHKHVNKCHYRSLQHDFWEPFSKHNFHSGDWVEIANGDLSSVLFVFCFCYFFLLFLFSLFSLFSFFFMFFVFSFVSLFYLCHLFMFFFLWASRQWDNLHLVFNWEHVSWGPKSAFFICSFHFYVFLFLLLFYETCKDMKIVENVQFF